jgi:hypothetical protein
MNPHQLHPHLEPRQAQHPLELRRKPAPAQPPPVRLVQHIPPVRRNLQKKAVPAQLLPVRLP